ncbi:hypothetical protein CRUP_001826, partial [Coryphaenoides rupestris]
CTVRNVINEESSPPSSRHSTPTPRETLHPLQGVIVFASFVLAVGVAIVAHRCWTDFWRRKGRSEGGGEPENIQLKDPEQLKANPEAIECEDEKSDQPPEPRTEPSGGNIP